MALCQPLTNSFKHSIILSELVQKSQYLSDILIQGGPEKSWLIIYGQFFVIKKIGKII